MTDKPTRRTVLTAGVAAAAAPVLMAKDMTVKDVSKGLAKPLTPANEKLTEAALKGVAEQSDDRLKFKLPENTEPSFVFQVRPGATQKW